MNQRGFAHLILIPLILFVLLASIFVGYLLFKNKNLSDKWQGLIYTNKGFITVNSQGEVKKNREGQIEYFLPPGMKPEYVYSWISSVHNGENIFKDRIFLSSDGWLYIQGDEKLSLAGDISKIYRWKIGSKNNPEEFYQALDGKQITGFTLSNEGKLAVLTALNYQELAKKSNKLDNRQTLAESETEIDFVDFSEESLYLIDLKAGVSKVVDLPKEVDFYGKNRKIEIRRLSWRGKYLYAFGLSATVLILDAANIKESVLVNHYNTYTPAYYSLDSLSPADYLSISPDGLKAVMHFDNYIVNPVTRDKIIEIDDKRNLFSSSQADADKIMEEIKNDAGVSEVVTEVGYNPFSFDSKKILQMISDQRAKEMIFRELEINTGKQIDFAILSDIARNIGLKQYLTTIPFMVYNPSGEYVILPVMSSLKDINLVSYNIKKQTQSFVNLKDITIQNFTEISFVGWYKAN